MSNQQTDRDPVPLLSEEEIQQIRHREQQAAEGPWHHENGPDREKYGFRVYDRNCLGVCKPTRGSVAHDEANSEFIKHARTDVPRLLATLDAERTLREQTQQQLAVERERASALRDAVCAIWSSTGAYPHEIPRLSKEALERDNERLDDARRL